MHLYVELWKAGTGWSAMSREQRAAYVGKLMPLIEELASKGVELVGLARNGRSTPHRAPYDYMAVWKMEDETGAWALEAAVERAGFHELFEQVNARGEIETPESLFGVMIGTGG